MVAAEAPAGWPDKIVIRGHKWKLKYSHGLTDPGGTHLLGMCDWASRTICLDVDHPPESVLTTLFHEMTHAHFNYAPLLGVSDDNCEALCDYFGGMMADFITLNKPWSP